MATVFIPALMRDLCGGRHSVEVAGSTLRQVLANLEPECPGLYALVVEDGMVRPGIQLAVNGIVSATGLLRAVPDDAEVLTLPAFSGGERERSARPYGLPPSLRRRG